MIRSAFSLRQRSEEAIADVPSLRMTAERLAASINSGEHALHKSGGHEKFWQFREYNEIDRPQDIDWRQSAKTDHIFVREKERHIPQSAVIWCNRSQSMDFQSHLAQVSKRQAAQLLSLALAILLTRGDEQIGFLDAMRSGRSDATLDRFAHILFEAGEALPLAQAASNSHLIFCSDFLEPIEAIEACFARYAARHRRALIVQILDPAEVTLPYSGHVVFDGGQDMREKVDNVSAIRAAYQARVEAHRKALSDLCADYGWSYVFHRTDEPPETALFNIWEILNCK
ncbi:MAG: DUF58 domain-containing protein [Bdellovibrionales bacterium]